MGGAVGARSREVAISLGTGVEALVGAVFGNEIDKSPATARKDLCRATMRLDHGGGLRSFDCAQPYDLRVGHRVRTENNKICRW